MVIPRGATKARDRHRPPVMRIPGPSLPYSGTLRPMPRCANAFFAHLALFLVIVTSTVVRPGLALADPPGSTAVPVVVLAFDSSDAEEQADGLTGALRSRVRAAEGWSLVETTQSLGMLTAAFGCPARPTPECQQKIAEQIKAERYLFGFLSKGPGVGQVTAAVHLFQKGQSETVVKETYADNLKDPNDDALQKVASRLLERLSGSILGVLVVRAPSTVAAEVVVDGEKRVPIEKGSVRIELSAGTHSVEFAPSSGPSSKQNVIVSVGRETPVDFSIARAAPPAPAAVPEKSSTRKIVGGVTMGAGVALGVVAVIELLRYGDLQDQGDQRASELNKSDPSNGSRPCREYDAVCFRINKDSKVASGLAIGFGAGSVVAMGVGAYFLFTDPDGGGKNAAKTRVVPAVTPNSGSLMVVGAF